MYTINIDTVDLFEATVNIEGATDSDAKCRLVVETNTLNFLFEGTLRGDNCEIPIKRLKKYLQEGDRGTLRLEVIADDMYFSPWQSDFEAKVSKKVTAEVAEPKKPTKPVVMAEVATASKKSTRKNKQLVETIAEALKPYNIKIEDVQKKKKTINHVVTKLVSSGAINESVMRGSGFIDIVLEAILLNEQG